MMSRQSAIHQLDIGPAQPPGEAVPMGGSAAAVVAGSIVAIDGSVSEQHSQDVLLSLLLAQLAASAKADRHKDYVNWYKAYQATLEQVGWAVHASSSFTRYQPQPARYTIATVIVDLLKRKTTSAELSLAQRSLAAFSQDPGGAAQFAWECPSHSGGIGNFQFGLATEDPGNGTVNLQLGRFAFEAPAHVTRLAFEEFDSTAKFMTSYAAMTLDEQIFADIRGAISKKLEGRLGAIVRIELPA